MADEARESGSAEFLAGFSDCSSFSQQTLKTVMLAIRSSNDLPAGGDDFDYYTSFDSFRELMKIEGTRVLQLAREILRHQAVKGNLNSSPEGETDEKFDILMDCNDQLLERVGSHLDEAEGLKKTDTALVVASITPKQTTTASWNKKNSDLFSASKSTSYRLLAARFTQRPQLRFSDKIDNSNTPFVPRIRYKPNAMISLEESLAVLPNDDTEEVLAPHPYRYELDHFEPTTEQLEKVEPQNSPVYGETPFTIVTVEAGLEELCKVLKKEKEIAIDLEHHSYRSYLGITCLMQISTRDRDFIVDLLEVRSHAYLLNDIFTDPAIVKVFHGADSDIEWLQKDFGLYVVNMFDTGQAARVLNLSRASLAYLLETYCQVQANKQYQLADWRIRPLPQELVDYAREDTHYLLYIYDVMKNQLIDRGNSNENLLRSVIQRSTLVCAKTFVKPIFSNNSHLELYRKSKKVFNNRQMAAFKTLYEWRDKLARKEDESTGYILPNHMMMQIAEILPRESQGVLACCNPIPPLVRQYANEVHQIIGEARELALVKSLSTKTAAMRPDNIQHPKYNVDNLLHCPHDLSHQDRLAPDPILDLAPDAILVGKSAMFGETERSTPQKTSLVSVLSWSPQVDTKRRMNEAQRKAAVIRASFVKPFAKYMPPETRRHARETVVAEQESDKGGNQLKTDAHINTNWKLVTNTLVGETGMDRTCKVDDTETHTQQSEKYEGESLREQIQKKRKHTDITSEEKEENDNRKMKMVAGVADIIKGFKAHDYSNKDYRMFQGSPDMRNTSQRGKKKDRPSMSGPRGEKKSHTYSDSLSIKQKRHWPKMK